MKTQNRKHIHSQEPLLLSSFQLGSAQCQCSQGHVRSQLQPPGDRSVEYEVDQGWRATWNSYRVAPICYTYVNLQSHFTIAIIISNLSLISTASLSYKIYMFCPLNGFKEILRRSWGNGISANYSHGWDQPHLPAGQDSQIIHTGK